jgi:anti-anti-sigma factor
MTKGVDFRRREDGSAFAVVELAGDLDMATNSSIRAVLRAAFAKALAADVPVIIDCNRVTFLGLSGITALLEVRQRYRLSSRLRLVGAPGGPVDRMVSLLGVQDLFGVHATVAAASLAEDDSQPVGGHIRERMQQHPDGTNE